MDIRPSRLKNKVFDNLWQPMWNTITSRYPVGTNVFDREWDVLVVLDACRVDALSGHTGSFDWLNDVETMRSVGSMSAEWVVKTFTEGYINEMRKTAFISRNVWSQRIFDSELYKNQTVPVGDGYDSLRRGYPDWKSISSESFHHYERVQPTGNQDDRIHPESTSVPHIVTDRAIKVGREMDPDRLIVWYTMPHTDFIADALDWSHESTSLNTLMSGPEVKRDLRPEEESWDPAKSGDVAKEKMWELYNRNLGLVLEYVNILLQNIDAKTVAITGDHGEGLGDGLLGIWGHPFGYPFAPIRTVPWATTTATDEHSYEPRFAELDKTTTEEDQRAFLEAMGYLSD
jgi:hypothetical protein